jgi:prolyl-tRNA synthetase
VVEGSSWVTGANEHEKHVFNLVCGRDFTPDGVMDIANVRDGDEAPDGLGPISTERGMEIGHVFQLGRKYAEALGLQVLDDNGKLVTVTMGSYGIGVTRLVAVLAETHHDDKGLVWPEAVAPYDVHIVAAGKDEVVFSVAEILADTLEKSGRSVLIDDRPKLSPGVKFADAEIFGVPHIVIVGRGASDGIVEYWNRRTGERTDMPLASVLDTLPAL